MDHGGGSYGAKKWTSRAYKVEWLPWPLISAERAHWSVFHGELNNRKCYGN